MCEKRCDHLNMLGEGIWIGGIKGNYACIVPFCEKSGKICKLNFNECELYE